MTPVEEYAELTRQLMELTAKRNALGRKIRDQRIAEKKYTRIMDRRPVVKALIAFGKSGDLGAAAAQLGLTDTEVTKRLSYALRWVRDEYPDHASDIPSRLGRSTAATAKKWLPHARRYLSEL